MAEGWLEPRTRIPFVGIIAMVVIVAVVAIFMKTQLGPFFPESEVSVQTAAERNAAGSASASFYGLREIPLTHKEYLQGTLTMRKRSMQFTIDPQTNTMFIAGQPQEEIVLQQDGEMLTATFEYLGIESRVDIDPTRRYLLFSEPGKSVEPIQVALSDARMYEGTFTVRNTQYLFQFSPASSQAIIKAGKQFVVPLTQDGSAYSGVWSEANRNHPVKVDTETRMATVEDVF